VKKDILIKLTKNFEESAHVEAGVEYWMARDIQKLLEYEEWRNFCKVIEKAKIACQNSGRSAEDHFVEVNKMVLIGSEEMREISDLALSRYACYLIAQNGDSRKASIAFAQTYFAVMKKKLGVPAARPLADFLPTITIKAKDFAEEITHFNVKKENLQGEHQITKEHEKNNRDVRQVLAKSNIYPEELPPEEDVKKLERRIKNQNEKAFQNGGELSQNIVLPHV